VWFVSAAALTALGTAARAALDTFHAARRLDAGIPREELRKRVFARAPEGGCGAVLERLAAEGHARVSGESVAAAGHSVRLTPEEARVRTPLLAASASAGLAGVDLGHPPPGLAADMRV